MTKKIRISDNQVFIDHLVKGGFVQKKIKEVRFCPYQDRQESANYCGNTAFLGNVCEHTTQYQRCKYYLER